MNPIITESFMDKASTKMLREQSSILLEDSAQYTVNSEDLIFKPNIARHGIIAHSGVNVSVGTIAKASTAIGVVLLRSDAIANLQFDKYYSPQFYYYYYFTPSIPAILPQNMVGRFATSGPSSASWASCEWSAIVPLHYEQFLTIYDTEKKDEIREFMKNYPSIVAQLFEIREAIREYFPNFPAPKLCLVKDPDIEDFKELFVYIPYKINFNEAYSLFKRFKKDWLYRNYEKFAGLVNIDLEYK